MLKTFPSRGRPGGKDGTGELILSGLAYVVIYQVKEDVVFVVRIPHATQEWPRRAPTAAQRAASGGDERGVGRLLTPVRAYYRRARSIPEKMKRRGRPAEGEVRPRTEVEMPRKDRARGSKKRVHCDQHNRQCR